MSRQPTFQTKLRRRLAVFCAAAVLFGEAAAAAEPMQAGARPAASESLLSQVPDELVAQVYRRSRRSRIHSGRYVLVRKRICRRSRVYGVRRCRTVYVRRLRRPHAAVAHRAPVRRVRPGYVARPPRVVRTPQTYGARTGGSQSVFRRAPTPAPQTYGARTGGSQGFFYCVGPTCPRRR